MFRLIYSLFLTAITPLLLIRLLWRGIKQPAYLKRWKERFGLIECPAGPTIWLHAVSVGETQAAAPLIRLLIERYRDHTLVVTTTTPTGSERVRELFGSEVFHVYSPYDLPWAMKPFMERINPDLVVIMETEIWPNLIHYAHQQQRPILLANARLSARSARGYTKVGALIRPTLQKINVIAAQAKADKRRFERLGAKPDSLITTGNIKFDLHIPASLLEQIMAMRHEFGERPIWIAGSTREGEDAQVLQAHKEVLKHIPDALLILSPRHPERFMTVAEQCQEQGFKLVQYSRQSRPEPDTEIFLGDVMGQMLRFYALADVAFVGGSLVETGGHNPLEPAAVGRPVLYGPHTFNFTVISQLLISEGAAQRVGNADELAQTVLELLNDPSLRSQQGEKGRELVERNKGALQQLIKMSDCLMQDRQAACSRTR